MYPLYDTTNHPETRSRDTVETLLENLRQRDTPTTPPDERGVFDLDVAKIKHNAKISALETVLDNTDLSYLSVYLMARERMNSGYTQERHGAESSVRDTAQINVLLWVLNDTEPSDPRTVFERIDAVTTEIWHLRQDVGQLDDSDVHNPGHADELDTSIIGRYLTIVYRPFMDLRTYMLNGEDSVPGPDETNPKP